VIHRRPFLVLSAAALLTALATPPSRAEAPRAVAFDQAAYEAALAAGTPMLVGITAPWCPTCRAQKAVFADLLQAPRYADLLVLEVDFDTRPETVRALGARAQSTLIVYAGGEEVGRSVGQTRPEVLRTLIDKAY